MSVEESRRRATRMVLNAHALAEGKQAERQEAAVIVNNAMAAKRDALRPPAPSRGCDFWKLKV
jgi:hypothetical protein